MAVTATRLVATAVLGAALALAPDARAAPPPVSFNPERAGVVVRGSLAAPAEVRLEVRRESGTVVALTPVRVAGPGPFAIRWSGGLGPTAEQGLAPDGRYRLRIVRSDGSLVTAQPTAARVDTRAPKVRVSAHVTLTMPAPPSTITVGTRDTSSVTGLRVLASGLDGQPDALGAWQPAVRRPKLPARLARTRTWGPYEVVVQARDAAGNIGESAPVALMVTPPPGGTRIVRNGSRSLRWVALVFDDGLDARAAASVLTTLESHDSGGTFCINGVNRGRLGPGLRARMRAAALAGHLDLCNHGYSHRTGRSTSESAGLADLRANAPLDRAIGISSIPFYRPPYGLLSPGLTRAAERLGYRYVLLWDVDPSDYASPPPSVVATRVVRAARPGSIVVLHLKASTAAALPLILRGLRAKGLRAVTAGRLLRAS